jgi:hypothetical protein
MKFKAGDMFWDGKDIIIYASSNDTVVNYFYSLNRDLDLNTSGLHGHSSIKYINDIFKLKVSKKVALKLKKLYGGNFDNKN